MRRSFLKNLANKTKNINIESYKKTEKFCSQIKYEGKETFSQIYREFGKQIFFMEYL